MMRGLQMPKYKVVKLERKRDREPTKRMRGVYEIKIPDRFYKVICSFFRSESIERMLCERLSDVDALLKDFTQPTMR